jgi:hypothetical protein
MDRIGSLYIDYTTGISYRLVSYTQDIVKLLAKERELGRAITQEELDAFPLLARYSELTLDGYGGQAALPAGAQRVWQPAE